MNPKAYVYPLRWICATFGTISEPIRDTTFQYLHFYLQQQKSLIVSANFMCHKTHKTVPLTRHQPKGLVWHRRHTL